MQLKTIAALATLLAAPIAVHANGCHTSDDSIGKYCKFSSKDTFMNAAATYCNPSGGHKVIEGQSYNFKTSQNPDGAGGDQFFWGNFRVDRGGDYTIDAGQCNSYMEQIFGECDGYGGWIDTSFGTVFGECIRV